MLCDPKWEKKEETKVDPEYQGVRLSEFIAWLETMPANERYDYTQPRTCALGQFKAAQGNAELACYVDLLDGCWLEQIVLGDCVNSSWTFGAALERAKKYQASV